MAAYIPLTERELEEMPALPEDATPEQFGRLLEEVRWQRKTTAALVKNVAQDKTPTKCRSCDAEIWWVEMPTGKKAPITALGLNHFADCPGRENHRK